MLEGFLLDVTQFVRGVIASRAGMMGRLVVLVQMMLSWSRQCIVRLTMQDSAAVLHPPLLLTLGSCLQQSSQMQDHTETHPVPA